MNKQITNKNNKCIAVGHIIYYCTVTSFEDTLKCSYYKSKFSSTCIFYDSNKNQCHCLKAQKKAQKRILKGV